MALHPEQSSNEQTDDLIGPFLTVDNKGWNRLLFIDSDDELIGFQCKSCSNICRDPSVIDCTEHKLNDIDDELHCYQCLTDSIQQNNNKCPVNGHNNPTIRRIKPIAKMIHLKTVICPFSMHFKNRSSNDDVIETHDVYDTPGGQREGVNDANENQCDCNWKGSLDKLITEHFTPCLNVNDPTFMLKKENKSLKMENTLLKQKVSDMEAKIKELTTQLHGATLEEEDAEAEETKNDIEEYRVYSIRGLQDKGYLSNDTVSDWIHQTNQEVNESISLFEFIPCTGKYKGFWYIRNTAKNKWLSYGTCKGRADGMVGLWSSKSTASNWQLTPSRPGAKTYRLECFYALKSIGHLGYQSDGKWNKLYDDKTKACIYRISLTDYGDHSIEDGGIYAIQCYNKYISYRSMDGFCMSGYKLGESSFKFIRGPKEDTWYIQNAFKDKKHDYWLSFAKNLDAKMHKCWCLYPDESNRALWRFIPCPRAMEFKIECIFKDESIGWCNGKKGGLINLEKHPDLMFKLLKAEI